MRMPRLWHRTMRRQPAAPADSVANSATGSKQMFFAEHAGIQSLARDQQLHEGVVDLTGIEPVTS